MKTDNSNFDCDEAIKQIKHYLPAQAPLKDFISQNTLQAFQQTKFHKALHNASTIFGYKVYLTLKDYRNLYFQNRINHFILEKVIAEKKPHHNIDTWIDRVIHGKYDYSFTQRVGELRANWKKEYHVNLDLLVHPLLFRILCSYLDQGISIWNFPVLNKGFLVSIRELESHTFTSFFKSKRAKALLHKEDCTINDLLKIVVGDESLYKHYLFDQQFSHQGWSGIVSVVENHPETLLDKKVISVHDLIMVELLLEIDALDSKFGENWLPLGSRIKNKPEDLFRETPFSELDEILQIWQEAFEWTYYNQVLAGIQKDRNVVVEKNKLNFQALFCIDDRECSIRRYIEHFEPNCETYGTPGFFGVEFYYKPEFGHAVTKQCPAPVTPNYLIKEVNAHSDINSGVVFKKQTHSLLVGWLASQTIGFWSALKLAQSIFIPTSNETEVSSYKHMAPNARLTIENKDINDREDGLQIGFTVSEMAQRVQNVLTSIGLIKDFAPLVYIMGHGASTMNNPHYAAYDCGACSGRPGSINARVFSFMANHKEVRKLLAERGILIPDTTQFVGALHDTTTDDIYFYDEDNIKGDNVLRHLNNKDVFKMSLDYNAKERARKFRFVDLKQSPEKIHKEIRKRAISLFEPRPEYTHINNALCIVGRRELTKKLFLDRRSFMNSYDYRIDPEGVQLLNILRPAAPVCGGINLQYYFSRVDNQKLGAGTKLPHNVMGLFGVANGIDGDLRAGLPSQMIEIHDPVRILFIIEHYPEVVLTTLQKSPETYEWFINEWVNMVVVHPDTHEYYLFKDGDYVVYNVIEDQVASVKDITEIVESEELNYPVCIVD